MKKLLFIFPVLALLAAGCSSAPQSPELQTSSTVQTNNQTVVSKLDVDTVAPGYSRDSKFAFNLAKLRQLQSALALYFEDNETYPKSLSELTPTYIKPDSSILDTFTDQQFSYISSEDNFEVCGSSGQSTTQLCVHKKIAYTSGIKGQVSLLGKPYSTTSDGYSVLIKIKSQGGRTDLKTTISADGSFSVELAPGIYTISSDSGKLTPQTVEVLNKQYTTVTLNFTAEYKP